MNNALLKSEVQTWETPSGFFNKINSMYNFTVDVCASKENAKVDRFFSVEDDGLSKSWRGERAWMNCPYTPRKKGQPGQVDWVRKAYHEVKDGGCELVACLLPARTDTKLFHDYVMKSSFIYLIRGRLRFVGAPANAVFPSMVVTFERSTYTMYPIKHEPVFCTLNSGGERI